MYLAKLGVFTLMNPRAGECWEEAREAVERFLCVQRMIRKGEWERLRAREGVIG